MEEPTSLTVDTAVNSFAALLAAENGENHAEEGEEVPEAEGEDAEPEESEETEEAEAETEDEDQPTYTVKIDGKEVAVPVNELVNGYQRNADYTRKTQEVAEQRKAAQGELESAKAERAHYAQQLEAVSSMLQQNAPQQLDWDTLLQQNPVEYLRQQRIHLQYQNQVQAVETERQQVAERQQADEAKATGERIETAKVEMLKLIPEWKNPKVATAEKTEMVEYLTALGYGTDEVSQINDPKVVATVRKAMKFDKITAQRANLRPATPQGPRTAQPGTPTSRSGNEQTRARQRLAKTGSIEDAAAVFMHHL